MKTATSGFISAISDSCPYHTVKFYLLGAEIDVIVKSFNYYGILSSTDGISIGNTCSSYCEFELYNNNYNLENNEVQIKVGVEVNGSIEYVSLGYFIVKNQVKQDNIIKYTAFDRMIKLEDKYSPSSVSNLTTISIINDMCSQLGFEFENTLDAISVTKSIVGYTYREMFGFISALHGANCIFNDSGKLEFIWFTQPSSDLATIDESVMYENGLELTSNSSFKVKYLKCATGETIENTTTDENGEETTETTDVILSVGSGTTGITLSNPLMTQEILTNIYNTYFFNFEYQPCTVKRLGNILLEVGDIVTVNLGTKSYSVPIMTIQHSIDGGVITDLVSLAETETEQSISYESPTQRYIAQSVGTQIQELSANMVTTDYIASNYAKINLANITKGCIENAMIKDATISDAKIVELTANKISAGTLSCDRLLFNGSDKSIVYYLNNMGDLTSEEVNTINGDTLTDRTITADKIVANSISANEIDVLDLFAQNITATGTITGLKVDAGEITGTTINGGSLFIGNSNGTYASIDSTGKLTCSNAKIKGEITATSLTLEGGALSIDASDVNGLSSVATSGNYNDLSGKPYIPPAVDTSSFIKVGDSIKLGSTPADGVNGFTVSSQGLLKASNAVIYGTLYATFANIYDSIYMYCRGYSQSDLWRVMKLEPYGMGDSAELIIGDQTEATMGFQRVTFQPDILFRGNLTYFDGVTDPDPDAGNITCNAININGVSMLNSKFKLGSDNYYISEYGTGKFSTIYEGGTALSDKYASYSHSHSGYASSSHTHSNYVRTDASTTITSAQVTMGKTKAADNNYYYFNDNATGRFNILRYTDLAMIKSSREYKTDIDYKDTEYWHNGLMNVKPCTFRYKYGDCKKTKIGVIAEDLIEYMPELVLLDEDGKCDTVTYIDFIIPLVSEVQRLNKEIDRLENLIKGVQA